MFADSETGLYYWNARYYDPRTGRGLSPDRMSVAEHVQRKLASLGAPNQPPLELNPYVYRNGNADERARSLACPHRHSVYRHLCRGALPHQGARHWRVLGNSR